MNGKPKRGRAALPRSPKTPSHAKSERRKDGAAQQHRPTAHRDDAPPYGVTTDDSPSPGGEGRGEVFAFIGDPEFKALAKEFKINWLK